MANSTSHILPYPIKGARYSLEMSFRVAAGTPTDPTTPDTEFSSDGGASFADCAEEITTGGGNGVGYLTLTGAETNANLLAIAGKSANCVTTPAILYPRVLASVGTGTLSAGSAGGGTLGTLLAYDVTGCFIMTTGGTGGGGTGGANNQARKIVTYNTSSGAFTVTPNWETTPDNTTTYSVLLPEGVTLGMLRTLNPATPGRTAVVDASGLIDANTVKVGPTGSGTAQTARDIGASVLLDLTQALPSTPTANSTGEALFIVDNLAGRINTAAGGGASTITLDASASSTDGRYVGYGVYLYGGTGGGIRGVGQERTITAYNGTTKVATVAQAWGTNPDNTSKFILYVNPFANVGIWNGTLVATPATAGIPDINVKNAGNTAWASGSLTSGVFATDAINAAALATDAVNEIRNAITGGAWALSTDSNGRIRVVDGTSAGEIDTNAGAIARVILADTITTYTGDTPQTGDSFARIGATGSGLTTLATAASISSLNNLSTAQVLAQIETALATTTRTVPGQVTPSQTPTIASILGQLYQQAIAPYDQDSSKQQLYNAGGTTVLQKRTVSDVGGVFSFGALVTGP